MKKLSEKNYLELKNGAEAIHYRGKNISILLKDNFIIKHIYRRNLWSSSTLKPYASRFIQNSKRLKDYEIQAPLVNQLYYYPHLNCDIIIYPCLPGKNILKLDLENKKDALYQLPTFIASIHKKRILFRDLHIENILYNENNFSLVDVTSVKFFLLPLGIKQRAKNLKKMFKRHQDFWTKDQINRLTNLYIHAAGLNRIKGLRLKQFISGRKIKKIRNPLSRKFFTVPLLAFLSRNVAKSLPAFDPQKLN